MKNIAIIFIVIVIVEALVEYGTTVYDLIAQKDYKKAVKQAAALAVCLFFCFETRADLFAYCGLTFQLTWLGTALTGVFGSRGSNYVADLLRRVQKLGSAQTTDELLMSEYLPDGVELVPADSAEAAEEVG